MKNPFTQKLNNPFGKIFLALEPLQRKMILRLALLVIIPLVTIALVFARTLAWQTNIVHTSGVMFSADNWDFSAQVALTGQEYTTSPGESGVIAMEMSNDSAELATASVKISKDQITEQMRSRLFFYIDTTAVRNSETLDRIYVNSKNSYTYTIFPQSELLLNDESKALTLHWEWTYDQLGYYVYGQKTQTGHIVVTEYLRPIEYDYDFMKTTFDTNGRLETVDGQKTATQFLTEFSLSDGYEGQISPGLVTPDGYYTVSYNEATGYGVFAYLCTLDQIKQGSINDTQFGNNAAELGTVTVQITGQNCSSDGTLVFDEQGLKQAASTSGLTIVKLNQDITLTDSLTIKDDSQVVIDLAGHKITSSADTVFNAEKGASLMISDGEIYAGGSTAVTLKGASVTLNEVVITNADEGIVIHDNLADTMDSVVYIKGCDITAKEDGVIVYGNAASSEKNSSVFIEDSTITGENYAGVICNGTWFGSDVTIKDSTIKGKYTSVYFPQKESTLTVENSLLEGYTGIAVKGGTVTIVDSTIIGTGEYQPLPSDASGLSMSGWWDTGDGIYLEANYTQWQTKITVSGNKTSVTGTKNGTLAVRKFPADATNAQIEIFGGSFNSDVSPYLGSECRQESSNGKYVVSQN